MDRCRSSGAALRRARKAFALFASCVLCSALASCKKPTSTVLNCIPQELRIGPPAAPPPLRSIKIYLDGSQSMAGYVKPGLGVANPMADLLRLLNRFGAKRNLTPAFSAFGREIVDLDPDVAIGRYSHESAYTCKGCDKNESRIDNVLDEAANAPAGSLAVVVTDLWLDNQSFSGSPEVALGGPLQDLLGSGRAVGLIGVLAPFNGSIYGVPGVGTYTMAGQRPLFVVASGSKADVLALKQALFASKSPIFAPERARFALYSTEWQVPAVKRVTLRAIGNGVSRDAVLGSGVQHVAPQFRLERSLAGSGGGRIEASFQPARAFDEGRAWQGPLRTNARVWKLAGADLEKCPAGTWSETTPIPEVWREHGGAGEPLRFRLDSASSGRLVPGNTYYIMGEIGTTGLNVPNPASQWLLDWSLPDDAAAFAAERPAVFKTLKLGVLSAIMDQEVAERTARGVTARRFGFIARIER